MSLEHSEDNINASGRGDSPKSKGVVDKDGEYKEISGFIFQESIDKIFIVIIVPISILIILFLIYSQDFWGIEISGRIKFFWWFVSIEFLVVAIYLGLQIISQNVKDDRRGRVAKEKSPSTSRDVSAIFTDDPDAAIKVYGEFKSEEKPKNDSESK